MKNKGLISFKLLLVTILLSISLFTVLILPSFAAYEVHSFNVQSSAYEKGLELDVAKRLVFTQNVIAKELENKNENTENTENKEVEETKTEEQPEVVSEKRSIEEVAQDVLQGKYGSGTQRREQLEAEGYNPDEVQEMVNSLAPAPRVYSSTSSRSSSNSSSKKVTSQPTNQEDNEDNEEVEEEEEEYTPSPKMYISSGMLDWSCVRQTGELQSSGLAAWAGDSVVGDNQATYYCAHNHTKYGRQILSLGYGDIVSINGALYEVVDMTYVPKYGYCGSYAENAVYNCYDYNGDIAYFQTCVPNSERMVIKEARPI